MKEQIKRIQAGEIESMTLDEILKELCSRKIGQRAIRLATPLHRRVPEDEVPSPKMKFYESPL